jgi:hypothetical protein
MHWECAECGSVMTGHRRPSVCPFCGIGGSLFVRVGDDPEDGVLDGSFYEAWLDYGLRWSGRSLTDAPGVAPRAAA